MVRFGENNSFCTVKIHGKLTCKGLRGINTGTGTVCVLGFSITGVFFIICSLKQGKSKKFEFGNLK
jgi:hypothetical protein